MTYIQHVAISQRIQISQFRFRGDNGHNYATFCAILVKIGPLTPKISQGVSVPFGTRRQKSIYHTNYLSKYWTELCKPFSIGKLMYADYKTEIIFAVVEETLLWWPINFGAFLQTSKLIVFTLCSGISNQNATSLCKCTDNYYTNASALCEILAKIGAVISEFKRAKFENLPRLGSILTVIVCLAHWHSETDWNIKILISFSRLIRSHFCTCHEHLVRFGLVTPEF